MKKLIATLALVAGFSGVLAATASAPASAAVCVRIDIVISGTSIGPIPERTCIIP